MVPQLADLSGQKRGQKLATKMAKLKVVSLVEWMVA